MFCEKFDPHLEGLELFRPVGCRAGRDRELPDRKRRQLQRRHL